MGAQRLNQLRTAMNLGHLLHPLGSQKRMLMVVASHTDENPQNSAPGWAVAGLLASQAGWERFERKWRGPAAGIPTWQDPNASALLKEGEPLGIGCATTEAAFASLPVDQRKHLLWQNADDPRLFCFQHCVTEAVRSLDGLPEGETVCFVMDSGDEMASTALWFFEDLKNLSAESTRRRLGALGVEPKRDFPLLAAADALAAECYRRLRAPTSKAAPAADADFPRWHFTVLDRPHTPRVS